MQNKLKCTFMVLLVFASSLAVKQANGEDSIVEETAAMKQSLDAKAAALINAPSGVFDVEIVGGEVVRLKIKGEADVPTSIRGTRGDRFAREKANRDARAYFTRFLGENVIFSESEMEGIVIQEKNGQESSEVMNASARLYSSNSSAMLKGLIVLMDRVEGEGEHRTCMVVLGWSKKLVNASNTAKMDMTSNKKDIEIQIQSDPVQRGAKDPTGNIETVTRVGNLDTF